MDQQLATSQPIQDSVSAAWPDLSLVGVKFFYADEQNPCFAIPHGYHFVSGASEYMQYSVAYPITGAPQSVSVYACFKISAIPSGLVYVRAYSSKKTKQFAASDLSSATESPRVVQMAVPQTVIGFSAENLLTLYNGGFYSNLLLNLSNVLEDTTGVGHGDIYFQIEYSIGTSGKWIAVGNPLPVFFNFTLDLPNAPWRSIKNGIPVLNDQFGHSLWDFPWTTIMNETCKWASGANTQQAAVQKIGDALWNLQQHDYPENLNYSESSATYAIFQTDTQTSVRFDGTGFMEFLAGLAGNGNCVDCTDLTTIMLYFGNAVGCNLAVIRLNNSQNNITLASNISSFQQLGGDLTTINPDEPPCYGYHDILVFNPGASSANDEIMVYDVSFKFYETKNGASVALPMINIPLSTYLGYLSNGNSITVTNLYETFQYHIV